MSPCRNWRLHLSTEHVRGNLGDESEVTSWHIFQLRGRNTRVSHANMSTCCSCMILPLDQTSQYKSVSQDDPMVDDVACTRWNRGLHARGKSGSHVDASVEDSVRPKVG